jgi:hypothetical protein
MLSLFFVSSKLLIGVINYNFSVAREARKTAVKAELATR